LHKKRIYGKLSLQTLSIDNIFR